MYVTLKGAMEEQDRKAVANPSSGLIIELAALQNEPDINKLLQKMPAIAIDPALYETKSIMEDVARAAQGFQYARMHLSILPASR